MRIKPQQTFMAGAVLLLALLGSTEAALLACSASGKAKAIPEKLVVFYSNETENELYRCGCKSNQMGGLSRRATVMAQQEAYPELAVDAGNFSPGRPGNAYDEFKQSYLLKIYDHLGYSALNVGPREFNRGKALLLSLAKEPGDKLISANVVDSAGSLVLPAYRIAEVEGLKIGIIGVITEQFKPNPDNPEDALATIDPIQAFGTLWPEVDKASDLQIVLSQLRDDELELLTKSYPDIDLVVGGPGWKNGTESAPWDLNGVATARVGQRGKYIGEADLTLDAADRKNIKVASYDGTVHGLADAVEENEAVETILEEFKERLRKGEVIQDVFEYHSEGQQFGYAGSIYCQDCHGQIYAGTLNTRHAQAFQTLAGKGESNNPGCLECHTVGFAEPGGYASKNATYLLANVQCESCHGPAADHMLVAQEYKDGKTTEPTDWKIAIADPQADTCVQCHNEENDPHYTNGVWPYKELVEQVKCSQWLHPATDAEATAPNPGQAAVGGVTITPGGTTIIETPKTDPRTETKPRTKNGG